MRNRFSLAIAAAAMLCSAVSARATVFINEIFINPPGSVDAQREFIELMGTPGMKLDGYAVAIIDGKQTKYYAQNFFDPSCTPDHSGCPGFNLIPEFDEFFALDGLTLGKNGILVLGNSTLGAYPTTLADSNFVNWDTLWSGPHDVPGNLENDGSLTIMLIRNRPGSTPANDNGDTRWAKDSVVDMDLITPEIDPMDGLPHDRLGNGNLDKGDIAGQFNVPSIDFRGATTPSVVDDLEIVDEVSYESDRGYEYDIDERRVDIGSTMPGLPDRHVHSLDDPQGFNPDCLTRVDYRTKGPGWPVLAGASGEVGPNLDRNWQDTATEQWIRGDSQGTTLPGGSNPPFFYTGVAGSVNVPTWLNDGITPDFNFAQGAYEIMAGRINPLATPFIPGDADRDGDCDVDDIAKIAAVFGDDNWVFSNSFTLAQQGNHGDPATQTRPWDVDATGDNGIEASDLQVALNFQGSTTGRIIGVRYDSTTPSATGTALNANTGTTVTITATGTNGCGRALTALHIGDTVDLIVKGRVTAGANTTAGQQNGIMQYVNDLTISTGGVIRAVSVTPLSGYATTRASLAALQGTSGDTGIARINGYSTAFTNGLSAGPTDLYRVTLLAIAPGSATINVTASTTPKFAASTPAGIKIGHTNNNGNPAASSYAGASITVTVTSIPNGDINGDNALNAADIAPFVNVLLKNDLDPQHIQRSDLNCDGTADGQDIQAFIDLLL